MKKVFISLFLSVAFLMSFNVKADPSVGIAYAVGIGLSEFSKSKYNFALPECAKKPSLTAKHNDANYYFSLSQCDYNANPGKYTLKK